MRMTRTPTAVCGLLLLAACSSPRSSLPQIAELYRESAKRETRNPVIVVHGILGARLAQRIDPATLRRAFAGFVGVMAAFILVREADAWLETAQSALPVSVPQMVFALVMLGVGVAAGRATRSAETRPYEEPMLSGGAGI